MVNPQDQEKKLTRICVIYDGNYFLHVSNYYVFQHARASRISIRGLHDFIKNQVAKEEGKEARLCHVVDAHYFRGRISAWEAKENNKLFAERQFDDILMNEGVTTHYLPLRTRKGKREEKGIDVWLALEALELAMYKRYNVMVLITSDGDYVPLIRKLNAMGTKVMLLSWDFEFVDENGEVRETRTSQELLEEATYPVAMHDLIESRTSKNDPMIASLFLPPQDKTRYEQPQQRSFGEGASTTGADPRAGTVNEEVETGIIFDIKKGFGFIEYPPNNLFFHASDVTENDFSELRKGDTVLFNIGYNEKGACARNVRLVDADM
jgi:cold shock CspA family protein/uncharacterized LabA/DUF88 family protein